MLDWKQISDSLLYIHTRNYLSYKMNKVIYFLSSKTARATKATSNKVYVTKAKNLKKKRMLSFVQISLDMFQL